jgi:integrase/recombinase XerD
MAKQQSRQKTKQPSITLPDAVGVFLMDREARNFTPKTLAYYRERLGYLLPYCTEHGIGNADELTAAVIRAYLVHRQGRGLAPHTVHGDARAIRTFVRFLADDGLIDSAPQFAMPKLPKTILPAFTPTDIDRLLDACLNERDRLIVLVLLDTGLRAAELCALNGGDIDTVTGSVLVRNGKGQKARVTYLGARTRRELARYWRNEGKPAPHVPVWTSNNDGERLTDSGLRQILRRIGTRAGVAHCHPHTFRRTMALWSMRAGMNIHVLAALLGHADIDVLKQYLAIDGNDLQQAHRQYGAVDNMTRRGSK